MKKKVTTVVLLGMLLLSGRVLANAECQVLTDIRNAEIGDSILLGKFEQDNDTKNGKEDVEWIILEKSDDRALLLSRYVLDVFPYQGKGKAVTWENCTMRQWLNSTFRNSMFTEAEQEFILSTYLKEANESDHLFPISISEAENYFTDPKDRQCKPSIYASRKGADADRNGYCSWCLRSIGKDENYVAYIDAAGEIISDGMAVTADNIGVRPAFWIGL